MIKMIATTISNSISEKPFCFLFIVSPWSECRNFLSYALAGYASDRSKDRSNSVHSVYFWNTLTHLYDALGDTRRCPSAVQAVTIQQTEMGVKGDYF